MQQPLRPDSQPTQSRLAWRKAVQEWPVTAVRPGGTCPTCGQEALRSRNPQTSDFVCRRRSHPFGVHDARRTHWGSDDGRPRRAGIVSAGLNRAWEVLPVPGRASTATVALPGVDYNKNRRRHRRPNTTELREVHVSNPVNAYGAFEAGAPLQSLVIDRRDVGPHDVQLDILYCGICHSDIHFAGGDFGPLPVSPLVPGPEIVGVVVDGDTPVPGSRRGGSV